MPSTTVAIQSLHELGEYFPRTSRQYFLRFTSLEILLPLLSVVLDPRPSTFTIYNLLQKYYEIIVNAILFIKELLKYFYFLRLSYIIPKRAENQIT